MQYELEAALPSSSGYVSRHRDKRECTFRDTSWMRGLVFSPAAFSRDCTCTRTECGTYILPVHRICAHVNMRWLGQDGRLITHKVGRSRTARAKRPAIDGCLRDQPASSFPVARGGSAWVDALENSLRVQEFSSRFNSRDLFAKCVKNVSRIILRINFVQFESF